MQLIYSRILVLLHLQAIDQLLSIDEELVANAAFKLIYDLLLWKVPPQMLFS